MVHKFSPLQTKLGRVRGLGAAHHGVEHWWLQRVTALALIPLCLWFVYSLVTLLRAGDIRTVQFWFTSPLHALLMVALLIAMFWHAKLGLQVVIEDYVHTPGAKYTLLLANTLFCFGLSIVTIVAVLKMHAIPAYS